MDPEINDSRGGSSRNGCPGGVGVGGVPEMDSEFGGVQKWIPRSGRGVLRVKPQNGVFVRNLRPINCIRRVINAISRLIHNSNR